MQGLVIHLPYDKFLWAWTTSCEEDPIRLTVGGGEVKGEGIKELASAHDQAFLIIHIHFRRIFITYLTVHHCSALSKGVSLPSHPHTPTMYCPRGEDGSCTQYKGVELRASELL